MQTVDSFLFFCRTYKSLYCYGAGNYGKKIRVYLDEQSISLSGFLTTNSFDTDNYLSTPVNKFSDVALTEDAGVIVGVGEQYRREIISNLESKGISNYFVVTQDLIKDIEQRILHKKLYPTEKNICVLLYHRVCESKMDTWNIAISPRVFEEHTKFLRDNYKIIKFDDEWNNIGDTPSVVITFDDGYADNFYFALPILEKYHVPATFFISTGNLDSEREFWWDELERILYGGWERHEQLSWQDSILELNSISETQEACRKIHPSLRWATPEMRDEILKKISSELHDSSMPRKYNRSLRSEEILQMSKSPFVTIGGHTVTHSALSCESSSEQRHEILASKLKLEEIIGKEICVFSHPFGQPDDYSSETIAIAKKCGYKKIARAYGGVTGPAESMEDIPRNVVRGDYAVEKLDYMIKSTFFHYSY